VISVCQPTVPVLAAISLLASRGEDTPRTMTMMGGPIDARKSPTSVNSLATQHSYEWFENNVIFTVPPNYPGVGRKVYPGFLQHTGFVAMNPERHAASHWDFYQSLLRGDEDDAEAHRRFYDEYNAVLDMDADYYLDTIRVVFQEFSLAEGTWDVAGERVRPQDITRTALFTIEGELDDISGDGQTYAAHELCTGIPEKNKRHFTAEKCGHYGIFSGRRWRTIIYPQLRDFIREHAPEPKNGSAKDRPDATAGTSDTPAASAPALAAIPAGQAQRETAKAAATLAKRVRAKSSSALSPKAAPAAKRASGTRAKPVRARKAA
jgi:poly(3-hydroxybutyrate) depolymerase